MEETEIPPLAYSVEQSCGITGLGRSFLYEAIASGDLRARKAGRRTIILHDDLQAYLAALPSIQDGRDVEAA